MSRNKNEVNYEDRFLKEKGYLINKLGYFFGLDFNVIISRILEYSIPPQTSGWHTLKEFSNKEKIVGTYAITDENRIVYEFFPKKKLVIFTNCLDHMY
jgi:hypothetical protein